MPWMSSSISLLLFVSLFLAFVRRFAITIDTMFRLVVCWNHVDDVAVWWVSPESLDNSLHIRYHKLAMDNLDICLLLLSQEDYLSTWTVCPNIGLFVPIQSRSNFNMSTASRTKLDFE